MKFPLWAAFALHFFVEYDKLYKLNCACTRGAFNRKI